MPFYEDYGSDLYAHFMRSPRGYAHVVYHVHPHWELYFCPSPIEQITFINGQTITYTQPLGILCTPFTHHGTSVDPSVRPFYHDVFYFGEDFLSELGERYFSLAAFAQSSACFFLPSVAQAEALMQLSEQIRSAPAIEQKLLFAVFFHRLCALCPEGERHYIGQANSYIQDVMRYIVANLDQPLTGSSIAAAFYISRNKLSADFKQFTNTTLHQFIVNLRFEHAKELLRKKEPLSIREIAQQCGFENEYYFYEFFKKQSGITPREYIRQRQKKPQ
ncbi:MAG: helix-turn-helix domain-containing protein [Clostridia bacterium]|nr:helix-turn-helix domain-containing protein [Clostridia bacterium]